MIDCYFAPTPNGWKITIMLEECGLPYRIIPLDLGRGDQFTPEFLAISPNNRMPAIVDRGNILDSDNEEGSGISLFESGAILLYLAQKTGRFLPAGGQGFYDTLQWLFWQVGGLGPMAGQASHFVNYADGSGTDSDTASNTDNTYARQRYLDEYDRLLGVMNRRLADRDYLAGDYSIADIACFPWLLPYKRYGQDLDKFTHLRGWFDRVKTRPAVRQGVDVGKAWRGEPGAMDDQSRAILFGQRADSSPAPALKTQSPKPNKP